MKYRTLVLLLLITFLGIMLRFWHLGQIPPSLDWDEASIGWNAYSFFQTGTDEYGVAHPLTIRSFNDYKPPVYVYALIPVVAVFGVTEWSIRLLSALVGSLTIVTTFFFTRELLKLGKKTPYQTQLALLVALLVSISPWTVNFSRIAFEANLAQGAIVTGMLGMTVFLRKARVGWLVVSLLAFMGAFYAYHSSRVFVPLIVTTSLLLFWWWQRRAGKQIVVCFFLFVLCLLPAFKSFIVGDGAGARFGSVSIFSDSAYKEQKESLARTYAQNKQQLDLIGMATHSIVPFYGRQLITNYLSHFDANFLFVSADGNKRHHAPNVGLLLLIELPFLLLGAYYLFKMEGRGKWLLISWILLAPLPAALAAPSPHAIRSYLLVPPLHILIALGLFNTVLLCKGKRKIIMAVALSGAVAINAFYFFHQYFIHEPLEAAEDFQYGYKEVVQAVKTYAKEGQSVYVTNYYDQPYIYFLLYGTPDPYLKNNGTLGEGFKNFRFINFRTMTMDEKKKLPQGSLYVVAPGDNTALSLIRKIIYSPAGKPLFVVGEKITDLGWQKAL